MPTQSGVASALPQPVPATAPIVTNTERDTVVEDDAPLLGHGAPAERDEVAAESSENDRNPAQEQPSISQRALGALRSAFSWRRSLSSENAAPAPDVERPAEEVASPSGAATIPVIAEPVDGEGASGSGSGEIGGAKPVAARASGSNPVCLICLDALSADDFGSGRAITLGCNCRGDLALRHRDCAVKWAQVKDEGRGGVPVCELCKHPVRNLPPLPARPRLPAHIEAAIVDDIYSGDRVATYADFAPSHADIVFDCVRVCWVAMIVSILFFEASLGAALWTGLIAGLAYSLMVRMMYRQHWQAMRVYSEQQAALRQPTAEAPPQVAVHVV